VTEFSPAVCSSSRSCDVRHRLLPRRGLASWGVCCARGRLIPLPNASPSGLEHAVAGLPSALLPFSP
jgi:hypothetical protein